MPSPPREPFFWGLFSGGGMLAAIVLPALFGMLFLAVPLGWVAAPSHAAVLALALHPLTRIFLFVLVMLSLFHAAHRFSYTLYDGLQLYHLSALIAVLTYGMAAVFSVAAGVMLVLLGR